MRPWCDARNHRRGVRYRTRIHLPCGVLHQTPPAGLAFDVPSEAPSIAMLCVRRDRDGDQPCYCPGESVDLGGRCEDLCVVSWWRGCCEWRCRSALCFLGYVVMFFPSHLSMLHFSLSVWYTQHHLIDSDFLLSVGHSSNLDPDLLPYICHTPSISTLVISRFFI